MPTPPQKLRINLFGEWWVLMKVELNPIEQEYFTQIANRLQLPLYQALLDPFFYYYLRLKSIPSLDKLPCKKVGGLLHNSNHQLEIWFNGKKTQKITIPELEPSQYLLPLYQVDKSIITDTNFEGIYIEQKEIGFIGYFETMVHDFLIDDLNFSLLELKNKLVLHNIIHKNAKMIFRRKDSVVVYQNSYEIKI
jgi:hypothetical protein